MSGIHCIPKELGLVEDNSYFLGRKLFQPQQMPSFPRTGDFAQFKASPFKAFRIHGVLLPS